MSRQAAKTSRGPMALSALEQSFPPSQRILTDPLAIKMFPASERLLLHMMSKPLLRNAMIRMTEKSNPGLWGGLMCRKRYFDEKLVAASRDIDAIVNLGAGFDTRVYRLHGISGKPIWELDQPANIEAKRERLQEALHSIRGNIRLVSIDFDREEIAAVLEDHQFSFDAQTFFIWEGVSQYLTEAAVASMFQFFARAAAGSRLAFTYVRRDFLEGKNLYGWEKAYQRFVQSRIWLFGLDPEAWPDLLIKYGWRMMEDVGYDQLAEQYVKPTGRKLAPMPVERAIYAEKL